MSKRSRRKQATIERANLPQQGGNVISPAAIQAMLAQMGRPGKVADNGAYFTPGQPMETQEGVNPKNLPRQWQFPLAYNTFPPDRTLGNQDLPAFQQLRNLAVLCDGIALCEKVWLDLIPKLTIKIQLRPELEQQGANLKDYQKEVTAYSKFFEKPDGTNDFHSWLRIAVIEQTQIDALYIYKQRDRAGRLLRLPIVQGDIMKPLLDDWGAIVAYQQFPWGIPGKVYTTDEMIYFRESPQANTPYGRSRVERVMIRVNQALRKAKKDLSYFTEGNQPFALMEVPEATNWTPDQIDAYEQMWNALVAGSQQQQVRVKFTQPGMKYTPLEQYQLLCDFDKFLLNYFAADYGLSMSDLAFTESIHKSSDEGQQNMLFRRTLFPLTVMYGMICTSIIRDEFHDDRFLFGFGGYEEVEDLQMLSTAYGGFLDRGVISPSDVAHAMHFPDIPQTGPYILTKTGAVFLEDLADPQVRAAHKQAQLAGLQMAAQPSPDGSTEEEDTGKLPVKAQLAQTERKSNEVTERDVILELNRWRGRALNDVKRGNGFKGFTTTILSEDVHEWVSAELERCTTAEEVREVFIRVKEVAHARTEARDENVAKPRLQHWQNDDHAIQARLADLKAKGVTHLRWKAHANACSSCRSNQKQIVKLGEQFNSGAYITPNHGNCECNIEDIYE